MIAAGTMWRTNRSRLLSLVTLAGVAVAVAVLVLDLGFFFRPGTPEVLGGLAHHAFVLGLMLVLTSGSRTVSLSTLGVFWLVGVFTVSVVGYLLESQLTSLFGVDSESLFQVAWSGPIIEETTRLAPVVIFLLLAGGSGYRHPSMSDGMLLGFVVGAGVSFTEDAHIGEILLSGDGWGAAKPWSLILPTISPLDSQYIALNNALWAALSGLTIGVAVMLRHWRWTWPIALVGPLLSFTNHLMSNHYTTTEFGIEAILRRGSDLPWIYETIRNLTAGGRLQMVALIAGAIVVVVVELMILRWVGKRDRMFPPLSIGHIFGLIVHATSKAGAARLLAAGRYRRLRRCVYFAGWRSKVTGEDPYVTDGDAAQLETLSARARALPVAT
jgi:protease prsW family protein